jgi:hypothetical protein
MTVRRRGLGIGSVPVGLLLKLPDDTSAPTAPRGTLGEYRVSELDQKRMAPTTLDKSRGQAEDLVMGVLRPAEHPFSESR